MRNLLLLLFSLALIIFTNCKFQGQHIENSITTHNDSTEVKFHKDIMPIFEKRCIACHACTDSPCGLKLDSWESLKKGRLAYNNLDTARLLDRNLDTELLKRIDSNTLTRRFEERPVNLHKTTQMITYRIRMGRTHKINKFSPTEKNYRIEHEFGKEEAAHGLDRICHTKDKAGQYSKYPVALRMPFGLPPLSKESIKTIAKWNAQKNKYPDQKQYNLDLQKDITKSGTAKYIKDWENFLNSKGLKQAYISRYIFEHTYLARFHFDTEMKMEKKPYFFVLKRFTSKNGTEIKTGRPYDSPNVNRPYYKFELVDQAIARKNHIVWNVNQKTLAHIKKIFIDGIVKEDNKTFKVKWNKKLPQLHYTGNYLIDLLPIPAQIRATFINEVFLLLAKQMVQGSVCVGPNATYAIKDRFWVLHLKPSKDPTVLNPTFKLQEKEDFFSPARKIISSSDADFLSTRYLYKYSEYEERWNALFNKKLTYDDLWKGSHNSFEDNSMITIFRHGISASAHKGLIGGIPETIWVLSYANAERIYYNLVVEYSITKNVLHQYITWAFMKRHRIEAENLFLKFFEPQMAAQIRDFWDSRSLNLLGELSNKVIAVEDLFFKHALNKTPQAERDKLKKAAPQILRNKLFDLQNNFLKYDFSGDSLNSYRFNETVQQPNNKRTATLHTTKLPAIVDTANDFGQGLKHLTGLRATKNENIFPRWIPSILYLRFTDTKGQQSAYTIYANRIYGEHSSPMGEQLTSRHFELESISAFKGIQADHAYMFFDLNHKNAQNFLLKLKNLKSEKDWIHLVSKYGVERDNPKFWDFYDWANETMYKEDPINAGKLDLLMYQTTTKFMF